MCYNECVLRDVSVTKRHAGDRLFASFSGVLEQMTALLLNRGSAAFTGIDYKCGAEFRSLDELQAAGYIVRSKVGDPLSASERVAVREALTRYLFTS